MNMPQTSRDTEVISLRTSSDFKNRLREWADTRGIPMTKLLEEMGELYARTEAGAERKLSPVELLLRPHFAALEREMVKAFEDSESKGNLFREESEMFRMAAERADAQFKAERDAWSHERQILVERLQEVELVAQHERNAREAAEKQSREATDTARALTASLSEARSQLETLRAQASEIPNLKKEWEQLTIERHRLAVEKENLEMTLVRLREDLLREKELLKRSDDAHRRELLAMEREFEARVAKAQLDLDRSHIQKTIELEKQIQSLQGELARRGDGATL
jgi:hypothetical protein